MKSDAKRAVVVMLRMHGGDRFFVKFGKAGQLQTAWSLAGATLFGPWDRERIEAATRRIPAGRPYWLAVVELGETTIADTRP
ncbi:hypothetical protein [Phenylobacterium sp.]|uniref:hypothetical protein n=1 Tax=Phenylobacterium sp. TaxID=1871053 RepID=UPI002FC86C3E